MALTFLGHPVFT